MIQMHLIYFHILIYLLQRHQPTRPERDITAGALQPHRLTFLEKARRNLSLPSEEAKFLSFCSALAPPNFPVTSWPTAIWPCEPITTFHACCMFSIKAKRLEQSGCIRTCRDPPLRNTNTETVQTFYSVKFSFWKHLQNVLAFVQAISSNCNYVICVSWC